MFVRLALKFVICNYEDFVNVILIYTGLLSLLIHAVCTAACVKSSVICDETPCNFVDVDRYLSSYGKQENPMKLIILFVCIYIYI